MRLPNDTDGIGDFECDPIALELVPNGQAWRAAQAELPEPCGVCAHPAVSVRGNDRTACLHCDCTDHAPSYERVDAAKWAKLRKEQRRRAVDRERKRLQTGVARLRMQRLAEYEARRK